MNEDWCDPEDLEEEREMEASVHRFQQTVETHGHAFFDEDEYMFIIDHFMTINELDMAEKAILQALDRYPDNLPLQLRRIGLLINRRKYDTALSELCQIDSSHPEADGLSLYEEAVLYLDLEQPDAAESKFNAVLSLPKIERDEVMRDPNFFNDIADMYESKGQLKEALVNKLKAIRKKTAQMSELTYLVARLGEEGQSEEALQYFERRTEASPLSYLDWLCLAKIRMEMQQYDDAIEDLHNVQAICGEDSEASGELAAIHVLTGLPALGEQELERYFSHSDIIPEEQLRWYNQIAQYAFDRELYNTCIRFCQKGIDLYSEEVNGRFLMAMALGESSQFEHGLQVLHNLLRIQPDHMEAKLLAGEFELQLERPESAEIQFRECCRLYSESDRPWLTYACFLIRNGDLNEAMELLNRLVSSRDNPVFLYRLANCHFMREETDLGRFYLDMAYAEDPEGLDDFLNFDNNLLTNPEITSFLNEINYNRQS